MNGRPRSRYPRFWLFFLFLHVIAPSSCTNESSKAVIIAPIDDSEPQQASLEERLTEKWWVSRAHLQFWGFSKDHPRRHFGTLYDVSQTPTAREEGFYLRSNRTSVTRQVVCPTDLLILPFEGSEWQVLEEATNPWPILYYNLCERDYEDPTSLLVEEKFFSILNNMDDDNQLVLRILGERSKRFSPEKNESVVLRDCWSNHTRGWTCSRQADITTSS